MKILICLSHVPDTTTKIKFIENKKLDEVGIQWVINPWDELSLTRALELKDNADNGIEKVTVASVGTIAADPTIRKALAIGADDAIRINVEPTDAYVVATQLAAALKNNAYDLILCGIESSDFNGSSVGGLVSEFMDIPSVSAVSSLSVDNGEGVITRDIDGGKESLRLPFPLVAIVQKGIAREPRIPSMRGIMMARSKPITVIEPVDATSLTEIVEYEMPASRAACKFVDPETPELLIQLLQDEAKVL